MSYTNINKIAYFRKIFNPKTGFTKHILKTNDDINVAKYIIVKKINCTDKEKKEIENHGYVFIINPDIQELIELSPDYAEVHGGLLTIFTYFKYLKFFRTVKLIVYIHSSKFKLRQLKYLKFKDLFIERKYTADAAFILNALVPINLYLFIIKNILGLEEVIFGIASENQSIQFKKSFERNGYQLHYIPSGVSALSISIHDRNKICSICTFSRAQLVRGIDVVIGSMKYLPTELKLAINLLPDISIERIIRMVNKTENKNIKIIIKKEPLENILSKHDIFIFLVRSVRTIPFQPLTVIEALATGKPVIVSSIPQMLELKKKYENVTIVEDYKNPKAVAKVIEDVIGNYRIVDVTNEEYEWGNIMSKQHKIISAFLTSKGSL